MHVLLTPTAKHTYVTGLKFMAIHQQDVAKVERHLQISRKIKAENAKA